MTNRREFIVGSFATIAAFWLPAPKLIGVPAGGYHAQVPEDIEPYLRWSQPQTMPTYAGTIQKVLCVLAWAPPGQQFATLQFVAGIVTFTENEPAILAGHKRTNLVRSMRCEMERVHEPGWVCAVETIQTDEPQGYDDDGEPYFYKTVHRWRRADYARWMRADESIRPEMSIA